MRLLTSLVIDVSLKVTSTEVDDTPSPRPFQLSEQPSASVVV